MFLRTSIAVFLASTAIAFAQPVNCARPDENKLNQHNCYVNRSGTEVHSPSATKDGAPPANATAKCRDGTYSFSQHRSGTCSHHKGVMAWLSH
jgi:Protein of unknown function (DUF3761)